MNKVQSYCHSERCEVEKRGLGGCNWRLEQQEQEEDSCVAGVLHPISGGSASSTGSTSGGHCHWQSSQLPDAAKARCLFYVLVAVNQYIVQQIYWHVHTEVEPGDFYPRWGPQITTGESPREPTPFLVGLVRDSCHQDTEILKKPQIDSGTEVLYGLSGMLEKAAKQPKQLSRLQS